MSTLHTQGLDAFTHLKSPLISKANIGVCCIVDSRKMLKLHNLYVRMVEKGNTSYHSKTSGMYTELLQLKILKYSLKYFTFKLLSISMTHENFLKTHAKQLYCLSCSQTLIGILTVLSGYFRAHFKIQ